MTPTTRPAIAPGVSPVAPLGSAVDVTVMTPARVVEACVGSPDAVDVGFQFTGVVESTLSPCMHDVELLATIFCSLLVPPD